MVELWGAMELDEWNERDDLGDLDLNDTLWGYVESAKSTCRDIWDIVDLNKLFKLTKEGKKNSQNLIHEIFLPIRSSAAAMHLVGRNIPQNAPQNPEENVPNFDAVI